MLAAVLALAVAPFATGAAAAADGDYSPVTTPDNLRVDVGVSSVTVDWDPSTPDADVRVDRGADGHVYLAKSRTYTVNVRAVAADCARSSEWSEPATFTTPDEFPSPHRPTSRGLARRES